MITELTPDQEQQMIAFREEWRKHGLSTQPVDKETTKQSISEMYRLIGKKPPIFIFCPSLLFCQFQIAYCEELFKLLNDKQFSLGQFIDQNLDQNLWQNLRQNLDQNLWQNLDQNLDQNLWQNLDQNLDQNLWQNLDQNLWQNLRQNLWQNLWQNLRQNLWQNLDQNLDQNLWQNLRQNLWQNLRQNLRQNLWQNLWQNLDQNLDQNLWQNLDQNLWQNLRQNLDQNLRQNGFRSTWFRGSMDAFWICFYEFPEKFLGIKYTLEDSQKLKLWSQLAKSCSWFWCYENYCFVSDRPKTLNFNNGWRLHNADGPSITWRDGWELHYWNGVEVPKNWIEDKATINKQTIQQETNAEKRRCLREILGPDKYFELLGGVELIDSDIDDQGNEMQLFRSKEKDELLKDYIQYLKVICPSTKREYLLYPPNQQSKNVWDAKGSTFKNEKIQARHGDVALLNINKSFDRPIIET